MNRIAEAPWRPKSPWQRSQRHWWICFACLRHQAQLYLPANLPPSYLSPARILWIIHRGMMTQLIVNRAELSKKTQCNCRPQEIWNMNISKERLWRVHRDLISTDKIMMKIGSHQYKSATSPAPSWSQRTCVAKSIPEATWPLASTTPGSRPAICARIEDLPRLAPSKISYLSLQIPIVWKEDQRTLSFV